MARIFSIQFSYEGTQHNAMVAMRTMPFFTEYAITMLDDAIAGLLPNNKIISTSKEHLVFSDSAEANSPTLMRSILQAVAGHLQAIGV